MKVIEMKRLLFFSAAFLLLFNGCIHTSQKEYKRTEIVSLDSIDLRCDIHEKRNDSIVIIRDTIISGIWHAYSIILSDKYILAFREYSEKYRMWKYMDLLVDNATLEPKEFVEAENQSELYYSDILPSASNKYVFFSEYYSTLDVRLLAENVEMEIVKFGCGKILDIEKGSFVRTLNANEVGGCWTCDDKYIVDNKIIFDPIDCNKSDEELVEQVE